MGGTASVSVKTPFECMSKANRRDAENKRFPWIEHIPEAIRRSGETPVSCMSAMNNDSNRQSAGLAPTKDDFFPLFRLWVPRCPDCYICSCSAVVAPIQESSVTMALDAHLSEPPYRWGSPCCIEFLYNELGITSQRPTYSAVHQYVVYSRGPCSVPDAGIVPVKSLRAARALNSTTPAQLRHY